MKYSNLIAEHLEGLTCGGLNVRLPDGQVLTFGNEAEELRATVVVHDASFLYQLAINPWLCMGESYVAGKWDVDGDRLVEFFGMIWAREVKNGNSTLSQLRRVFSNTNRRRSAKRAVEHHYDRGNDLFHAFLDESLTYSCGYMMTPEDSLEEMQQQKYDLICAKLEMHDGARVIDLGCGWGGFLLHLAKRCSNASGVGVTISENQCELARRRIKSAGLDERVSVELCDYRDAPGQNYDFLVSIGMFEHVGRGDYAGFMNKAGRLLKRGGRGLLHTMALTDDVMTVPDPWISKYIFPRYRLPRLEEIIYEMRQSGLQIGHIENLKPHYAETFRRWRLKSEANKAMILDIANGDERFFRMWNYYLQLCEAGFRYGTMEIYQILFSNLAWSFPKRFAFGDTRCAVGPA